MVSTQVKPVAQALQVLAAHYKGDPEAYARRFLRRQLTAKQAEILSLLDTPPYRVLVPSANTQGKTFAAAVRASYFFDTHVPSVTLATAPTKVQIRDLLFKELRRVRPSSEGFAPKDTRLQYAIDHYVHGFTAAKADAFQGRHEENLGIIFDEATGVYVEFWQRAETMFGGHAGHWWLATYNPNDVTSHAFQVEDRGGWHVVRLNALEHPNIAAELVGNPPVIPSAIRLDTILRRIKFECRCLEPGEFDPVTDFEFAGKSYRPLTPEFEAQILGRWPIAGSESIWTPALYNRARQTGMTIPDEWALAAGCDVARFGDDKTTIAVRKGPALIHLEALTGLNSVQVAERLRVVLTHYAGSSKLARQVPTYVDETGGYGASVVDNADGYHFIGVNAASQSPDPRFPNTRSWLWWNLRYIADAGACDFSRIPEFESALLRSELCSPRYHLDAKGRRVVEIKSQVKQRLTRSPDRADAVNLCYLLGA